MTRKRRIGLVLNTASVYGTQVVAGIAQAAREHNCWQIHPMFLSKAGLAEMIAWRPDGVIGRMECDEMLDPIRRLRVPIVDIDGWEYRSAVQSVLTDDFEVGRLAARHFLQRGRRTIGFCGIADRRYSAERQAGLAEVLAARGLGDGHCHHLPLKWLGTRSPTPRRRRSGLAALRQWLITLPKPAAVLCCEDVVGVHVAAECAAAGIAVPEDVAVLGVGNDEALCTLAEPALSSVPRPAAELGLAAGRWLHRLLDGARQGAPHRIAPRPIVERTSTDSSAVDDPLVRRALQFMRDNAHRPFGIAQVLDVLQVSRRTFEMRFRAALGRSPHDEIEALRMARAEGMLAETDCDIASVAAACGFSSAAWFGAAFRRKHGVPPSTYRRSLTRA